MPQAHANGQVFMDHYRAFRTEFLQHGKSALVNLVELAIRDRLARLFPDDDPTDLAILKPYWVDLPPDLLKGELNLVHQPSIFNTSDFTPHQRVLEVLALPFAIRFVLQWFTNKKVPEAGMNFDRVAELAGDLLRMCDARPRCRTLYETDLFAHPKGYPRSLVKSLQHNAGVLFCAPGVGKSALAEKFPSAAEGRDYFRQKLARVPNFLDRGVRPLVDLNTQRSPAISWEPLLLRENEAYVWCHDMRDDHLHCPPSECESRVHKPPRRRLLAPGTHSLASGSLPPPKRSIETPGMFPTSSGIVMRIMITRRDALRGTWY